MTNSFLAGAVLIPVGSACLSVVFDDTARRFHVAARPKSYRKSSFFKLELGSVGVAGFMRLLFGLALILSEFTPPGL